MIYTLTPNPSLDYYIGLSDFSPGTIRRAGWEEIYPGGKGINVSLVLKTLGVESVVLGFAGGFTGREIARRLALFGCPADFVPVEGTSRINVKVFSAGETQINGRGPAVSEEEFSALLLRLQALREGDILVLSGSLPAAFPPRAYERIFEAVAPFPVRVAADAGGEGLKCILPYRPFLIKPCKEELEEFFGRPVKTPGDILSCAEELQRRGAANVLVSLGSEGALFLDENKTLRQSRPPEGEVKSTVGAGDSMVAGFLAGYLEKGDFDRAFRLGLAAGSACAFCPWLPPKKEILRLMDSF